MLSLIHIYLKDGRIVQTPVRELDAAHGKRILYSHIFVQSALTVGGIQLPNRGLHLSLIHILPNKKG